jgi:catechol 2,3-dioxygenase-like lactoylglutathione lyase family enzyme
MTTESARARGAGVHGIDHFMLEVPDLDEARRFVEAFGLRVEAGDDELRVRASGDHVWCRLRRADRKRLAYVSLGCFASDFAGIRERTLAAKVDLRAAPIAPVRPAEEGFWFLDPDGNSVQVMVAPKVMPDAKTPPGSRDIVAGQRGVLGRSSAPRVMPTRLSHVLLFTPDVTRQVEFYTFVLGLKLSDRCANDIAFMHGRHGSDHHLIAFGKSDRRGWHHSAWEVLGVDDVGLGAMQMRQAGYPRGWGVSRHVLGSNYFWYAEDPWGSFWEYSAHMDYVPEGFDWPAADHPGEDAFYLWGPDAPGNFHDNTG